MVGAPLHTALSPCPLEAVHPSAPGGPGSPRGTLRLAANAPVLGPRWARGVATAPATGASALPPARHIVYRAAAPTWQRGYAGHAVNAALCALLCVAPLCATISLDELIGANVMKSKRKRVTVTIIGRNCLEGIGIVTEYGQWMTEDVTKRWREQPEQQFMIVTASDEGTSFLLCPSIPQLELIL